MEVGCCQNHQHLLDNCEEHTQVLDDEDVLSLVDSIYYTADNQYDFCRYELERLPIDAFNAVSVEKYLSELCRQQSIVSKKLLQIILKKQNSYAKELEKIMIIASFLQETIITCHQSRSNLKIAKNNLVLDSLKMVVNYRKRKIIKEVLHILYSLKNLHDMNHHLQGILNCGDYASAIALLSKFQQDTEKYKHLDCIASMNRTFQSTLEQIEENLDSALLNTCTYFDINVYTSLQNAYALLGKTHSALDQLHMHFTATIHNVAFRTVHRFAGGDLKKQYNLLCSCVPSNCALSCLTELCREMWTILRCYYSVILWHKEEKSIKVSVEDDKKDFEAKFNEQYLRQKLESGIIKIWSDIELKIVGFLKEVDVKCIPYQEYIQILCVTNKIAKIRNHIDKKHVDSVSECMKKQCLAYISQYHRNRLDELRIFLENDGWKLCPVKTSFTFTQLQEFKHLKRVLNDDECLQSNLNSNNSHNLDQLCNDSLSSPFDLDFEFEQEENVLLSEVFSASEESEDEEFPGEMKTLSNETLTSGNKYVGPIVTNTTLSILRNCGNYLDIIRLFGEVAPSVIRYMFQFLGLYFYAVHLFFTGDLKLSGNTLYTTNLKRTISRIKKDIVSENSDCIEFLQKVRESQLLANVDLDNSQKLFGLTERIVAVESLVFLSRQFEYFKDYMDHSYSKHQESADIQQLFSQTISSCVMLRKPVYISVVARAFNIEKILNLITNVNWEIEDVMSQHNIYVDNLIQSLSDFKTNLVSIEHCLPLDKELYESLWENVAHLVSHTLVEGFASAKKCSNGGRALMQLDFTQFVLKFENITHLKPMPHKSYVESYIKAYYLPESSIESWITTHPEYSINHLIGLVSCACRNKKVKQKLLLSLNSDQRLNQ